MVVDALDVPDGYKRTEVGVIPNEWTTPQIQNISKLINGRGFKPYEWRSSGLPIIRIQNLNGSQDYNYFDGHYNKKIEVGDGQLLFAWSGSRGTSFGPHYWNGPLGLLNYHTWKVISFDEKVESSYYFHALKGLTKDIEDSAHGASALVHVQKWEIEARVLPLPTRKEQIAIADALTDADEAIRSLEAVIAKKRDVKQATLHALLSPTRRLPGFNGDWEVNVLGDIATIETGSRNNQDKTEGGRFSFFVRSQQIERINSFKYDCEAILVPDEGNIGSIFHYISGKFDVHQRVYMVRNFVPYVSAKFLFYYMKTYFGPHALKNTVKATVDSLRRPTFIEFEVNLPPLPEQIAIAETLSDMDAAIEVLETRLDKLRDIKQGMMQVLLTGKVRLI